MKKLFLIVVNLLTINKLVVAQSVSLATTTINPTKGTVVYNNGTNQLQYWNGSAWIPITNAASGTGWALNGNHIYNSNNGNVGIGITSPTRPLSILPDIEGIGLSQESPDGLTKVGFFTSNGSAYVQTHTNHDLKFGTNNQVSTMILQKNTGNVGIGTTTPTNKLQIGSLGSSGFATNQFAIGNGTNAMAIFQTNASTLIGATTDIVLKPKNNGNGYVGINVDNPTNKLQIGSMGGTGFATNDFAIGNGAHAMAISQTNISTLIGATTDIVFKPRNNGAGKVGINTDTPRAPLDVTNWQNSGPMPFAYFRRDEDDGHAIVNSTSSAIASISIIVDQSVVANQFVAVSDARIKNIISISNSAKDLETIKALKITDYTMKDKVQYGNKSFKKVIAQEVEKVYPQAVSRVKDVVPDIYSLAENVVFNGINKTLKCSLLNNYSIKIGEIIEFIHPKEGKLKAEVIEVSGNTFTVKDWQYPTDKIFVYGREVHDFRTVDYEAISMLGISAIQQLAKENEELKAKNEELRIKNEELNRDFKQLKFDLSARLEAIEAQLSKTPIGN